ncbi:MAG: AI-2E family transporter [Solirubrobacterales bacterium]
MSGFPHRVSVEYRAVLLAAALVVAGILFSELLTLLVAILITVLVAIPLEAAATRLERLGVPRPIGALAGLLLGIAVIAGILALILPPLIHQVQQFIDQVPSIVDDLRAKVRDLTGAEPGVVGDRARQALQRYTSDPAAVAGRLATLGFSLASMVAAVILIIVTAYYMAVRPRPLIDGVLSLLGPERREWGEGLLSRIRAAWIGWMQGVAADMLVTGTLTFIGLTAIGLHYAALFAVIPALLVVVPYFGAVAGAIPPILYGLTQSPTEAALVLAVYLLVQQVEGHLIIPLVMSNRVRLHPAVIAIGVVAVGSLFGFIGLFVAVPILSLITILVDEIWVQPRHRAAAGREARSNGSAADRPKAGAGREAVAS